MKKLTTDEFITRATQKHGDKYDYSLVDYKNSNEKVKIICKKHGIFEQAPSMHVHKLRGCPVCGGTKKLKTSEVIQQFKEVHRDKYNYNNVNYINNVTKIEIKCKQHGTFLQTPKQHKRGEGCMQCGIEKNAKNNRKNLQDLKNECKNILPNTIIIDTEYKNNKELIKCKCKFHGVYYKRPDQLVQGYGCHLCNTKTSIAQEELTVFLKEHTNLKTNFIFSENNKQEIDILINNIGIEFNGIYWHSNKFKNITYHLNKTEECNKNSIDLIHIFEDEWQYKKHLVKTKLLKAINIDVKELEIDSCAIKTVSNENAKNFLKKNSLKFTKNSDISIGLIFENKLVAVMTFIRLEDTKDFELIDFCELCNLRVKNYESKLLKHFVNNYDFNKIISYDDRRWSNKNIYKQLGFDIKGYTEPNKYEIKNGRRVNEKINSENTNSPEKLYIYDCGDIIYEYK